MSIGLVLLEGGWVSECFFACYGEREKERVHVCMHKKEKGWKFERGRVKLKTQNWVSPSLCYSQQGTLSLSANHWMIVSSTSFPMDTYYNNNEELVILAWNHPKKLFSDLTI
jgi:hypothetical protein